MHVFGAYDSTGSYVAMMPFDSVGVAVGVVQAGHRVVLQGGCVRMSLTMKAALVAGQRVHSFWAGRKTASGGFTPSQPPTLGWSHSSVS